ncbi:MAG TPA: chaperonin GroEL [Planctomycetota bacterium]|nr:chaperonin GroEL [Planctomycetota bacterium]
MAKQLCFDADAREALRNGVVKLARAVKSTLGPRGRCAVIDKGWGGPTITKDGYTVADEIDLKDKYENLGAQLLKEAASKTNDVAGDGTTTATVLAEAIYLQGLRHMTAGANVTRLNRGIREAADVVLAELTKKSQKVGVKDEARIGQVASIAANGDREIGDAIVKAFKAVAGSGDFDPKNAVITVEEGKGIDTEVKVVEGMQFDRGYLSPHFVTDAKTLEAELKDALILIHEDKISNIKKLIPILEAASKANKPLVIIAEDVEGEALATLVVNKIRGIVNCCAVKAPGYGDRRKAMLEDIAVLTGAKPVFKDLGEDLEKLTLKDLGRAKRVTVAAEVTTIVEGAGKPADVSGRRKQIRREIEETDSNYDREKLQERLAKLESGVATINVGAATETEMKEKKARMKDALAAVRAALEEGLLPGGGTALARLATNLKDKPDVDHDVEVGFQIVRAALTAPLKQIAENAGASGPVVLRRVLDEAKFAFGYDADVGEYKDLVEAGVVDPAKVVRSALVNAVSVATLLLSTSCLVTEAPKKKDDEAGGGHDDHDHEDMDY